MNNRQTNVQTLSERARQDYNRPEAHPFMVGETYANRRGKYEVLELAPPRMTVRYEDGERITADIMILARIWENLKLPPEKPEAPARGAGSRGAVAAEPAGTEPAAPIRAARTAPRFQGLTARDFAPAAARAAWRSQVGSRLATRLAEITDIPHKAFPVENRPVLYIGREPHFSGRSPQHRAKFLFRLTAEDAEYGFYVERAAQKMDLTWDWRRFMSALYETEPWGEQVRAAMLARGLTAEAESYAERPAEPEQAPDPIGRWTATAEGLTWLAAGASDATACTWRELADVLAAVEPTLKCDFYLLGRTPKAAAIAASEELIERAAQTYAALMPLYSASAR